MQHAIYSSCRQNKQFEPFSSFALLFMEALLLAFDFDMPTAAVLEVAATAVVVEILFG